MVSLSWKFMYPSASSLDRGPKGQVKIVHFSGRWGSWDLMLWDLGSLYFANWVQDYSNV